MLKKESVEKPESMEKRIDWLTETVILLTESVIELWEDSIVQYRKLEKLKKK